MAIVDFPELKALLIRDGRLMALDVGSKTIGVATSDALRMLATPLTTIKRSKLAADLGALADLAKKHEVKALAIGLPLNMDGTDSPRTQSTRAFARNLTPLGLPLLLWDERYTLLTVLIAAFGRAISEVGAVMVVGGNIDGFTRVMTTAIALETSKGDLPLALALGLLLLAVVLLLNVLIALVRRWRERHDDDAPPPDLVKLRPQGGGE